MLPLPVLQRAAEEMTDYRGSGMSVAEMSHRSSVYDSIIKGTEASLRRVMSIPDNYKVLFMLALRFSLRQFRSICFPLEELRIT